VEAQMKEGYTKLFLLVQFLMVAWILSLKTFLGEPVLHIILNPWV
jgi:hypothetical protein